VPVALPALAQRNCDKDHMDLVAVSSFYVNVLNCVHDDRHDAWVRDGRHDAWVRDGRHDACVPDGRHDACVHHDRHDACVHHDRRDAWAHAFRDGDRHGDHRGVHDGHRDDLDVTYPGVRHACGDDHRHVGCDENHGGRHACDDGHHGDCRDVDCDEDHGDVNRDDGNHDDESRDDDPGVHGVSRGDQNVRVRGCESHSGGVSHLHGHVSHGVSH